jgi:hypothetical protein
MSNENVHPIFQPIIDGLRMQADGYRAANLAEKVITQKRVLMDGYSEIIAHLIDNVNPSHKVLTEIISRTMDKHNSL